MDFQYDVKDMAELSIEEYNRLERYRCSLIDLTANKNKVERFTEVNGEVIKSEVKFRSEIHQRILKESNDIARFLEIVIIK